MKLSTLLAIATRSLIAGSVGFVASPSCAADRPTQPKNVADTQIWDYKSPPWLKRRKAAREGYLIIPIWIWRSGDPHLKMTCSPKCQGAAGSMRAPSGYRICEASLMLKSSHPDEGVTFNGTLHDNMAGLAWHSAWDGQSPNFRARFKLVPDDGAAHPECVQHNGPNGQVWDCAGWDCHGHQTNGLVQE
jgi:hypothetical protein